MHWLKVPVGMAVIAVLCIVTAACAPGSAGQTVPAAVVADTTGGLQEILDAEFTRLGIDPDRVAAVAPQGEKSRVLDLACGWSTELVGYKLELTWTEAFQGDYNQDGIVEIGDLTPLGQRFNGSVEYRDSSSQLIPAWFPAGDPADDGGVGETGPPASGSGACNWRTARVDGNGDGLISVSDITTIAQHWNERVSGYRIYRLDPGASTYQMLPNPDDPEALVTIHRPGVDPNRPVRYKFIDTLEVPGIYGYFVVPYDSYSGTAGPATDAIESPVAFSHHITNLIGDYAGPEDGFPSIALINGKPAIAVQNPAHKTTVDYIRSLDENGLEWADPVNANYLGEWGPWFGPAYMSLAEINYYPAIAYFSRNESVSRIWYVHALDAEGTEWSDPVLVMEGFNCNGLTLLEVNDRAAICFYNNNMNGLKFVRAEDYKGDTWGTPLDLSPETVGADASLVIVDGNPAICFNSPLQYIRALDKNGETWGPVQYPVDQMQVCDFVTMSVVGGVPSITCTLDLTGTPRLTYIRASDATGSAWDTPVYICDSYQPYHLLEVEDQPVIGGRGWITRAVDYQGFQWEDPWDWLPDPTDYCHTDMIPVGENIGLAYYDRATSALSFMLILH